jgi:FkbM family methyltransferase
MDSRPSNSHTDAVRSISNILREPAPRSEGESRKTAAEIASEPRPAPASEPRDESSEMAAESNTSPAGEGAKLQSPSSDTGHVRTVLWRFLVLCTEPFFSRLRAYLLAPLVSRADGIEPLIRLLHPKFDSHAAETRRATEGIQHQIVHLEFQSRSFAKQLSHLESQFGMLANQLARLKSHAGSVHGRIQLLEDGNSLVAGGELLARTPNGYVLVPPDGPGFARFLAKAAVWEQATSRLLDLALREGMTFVDVGANVGLHTLQAARRVGPAGAVIALEPNPHLFRLLRKSIRINDKEDICNCINIALSSADGVATLDGSKYCGVNSLNEEAETEFHIKTARLDDVLRDARRVDVVKIDAGGAELDVLEGMNHVLSSHRDIVLIVEYGLPQLKRMGIRPVEWFDRFFAHDLALFAFEEQTSAWRQITEDHARKLPTTTVAFVRPGTNQWTLLKEHEP